MPIVRDPLYWPRHLREKVKHVTRRFQKEELKCNRLVTIKMRDVIIVCIAEALPSIERMPLELFQRKLQKLKRGKTLLLSNSER